MVDALRQARGRLGRGEQMAIIDIGSNSVRLVVYENISRSPAQVFNEKEMAGLGRQVATTGRLADDAVEKALIALNRFRILCEAMKIRHIRVIATAAARYASNGAAFIEAAQAACGQPIELISGDREAMLSAYGVISGFERPDGIVGDLGGGSLELIDVEGNRAGNGVSLALGGLALMDRSHGSMKAAEKIVKDELDHLPQMLALKDRNFYAVGGTWRALATLHQHQSNYALNVRHAYQLSPRDVGDFARMVERVDANVLDSIESVSSARRPLLAYGALVLDQIIKRGKPNAVIMSAQGVREGLLYELLTPQEQAVDPLFATAADYNELRARHPGHANDLIAWSDQFMESANLDESFEERRLRRVACLLSDIGWRAHPDYRGEQTLNVIANAAFTGVDHAGRAVLALSIFYRYAGLKEECLASYRLQELMTMRQLERARIHAATFRIAYLISAAMPGVLPRVRLLCTDRRLLLHVPPEWRALASERVTGRLKQLAKLLGREHRVVESFDDQVSRAVR